jgi:hypothetical protein
MGRGWRGGGEGEERGRGIAEQILQNLYGTAGIRQYKIDGSGEKRQAVAS